MEYLKTSLEPYKLYEFRLQAMNDYGVTNSDWSQIYTKEDSKFSF